MFYSQALTNLKIADTYSMRTLCRMTKMEDTAPVNRSRATGHNHQLSETARENTSNQAYLANGTKEQSSNRKCILQNYHILLPSKIYAHSASVRSTLLCRSLYCPFPKTFGGPSLSGKNVIVEAFQLSCIFVRSRCHVLGLVFALNSSLINIDIWRRCW